MGIYCIYNAVSKKRYIGQTSNIDRRQRWHFSRLKNGAHHNEHLQMAFLKYGEGAFEWQILEEVQESMLDVRERAWIAHHKSDNREFGYNKDSGGNLLHRHSEETKRKMSRAAMGNLNGLGHRNSEEALRKMSAAKMGHPVSLETRRKLSKAWETRTVSDATKRKMSASQKKKYLSPAHNLQVLYPEVAIEFDLEKNYPSVSSGFTPGSRSVVWWKCKEGHSWQSDIHRRTGKIKHGCPICGKKKSQESRRARFLRKSIPNPEPEQHVTIIADV